MYISCRFTTSKVLITCYKLNTRIHSMNGKEFTVNPVIYFPLLTDGKIVCKNPSLVVISTYIDQLKRFNHRYEL